jgi:CheY-like chemotaxis protein/predicted regulator of Ras-like GTPase activity (Roadblock/LC7/MglB family)
MYILVVDPNEAFATLLSEELSRQGYDTTQCADGAAALAAAQDRPVDLALLDMALEDPGALELADELREIQAEMRLMLIPLMGEDLSPEAASVSVQGVLPKPFFLPELPERIEAALEAPLEPPTPTEDEEEAEGEEAPSEAAEAPEAAPPEPAPVEEEVLPPTAAEVAMAEGEEEGISYQAFTANRLEVEGLMNDLAQETGADAVLLTYGGGLLTWVGGLGQDEAESISRAVIHGWRTSAEVARILGREQVRFEQSIAGGDYMLYALSVEVNAIMAVAVRGSAPLGLLRHRARGTAQRIARLCTR